MQLKALDLYCGAGGATRGLQLAGFEVCGVDFRSQPRYVGDRFIKSNVFDLTPDFMSEFDLIYAGPPCQRYTTLTHQSGRTELYPHISKTREFIITSTPTKPYIIENVEKAPLQNPVILCGTMFPPLRVIRHRGFESNLPLSTPFHITYGEHPPVFTYDKRKTSYRTLTDDMIAFVTVTGGGNCSANAARDAMGIPWMIKDELNEAIPPAYTQYLGLQVFNLLH